MIMDLMYFFSPAAILGAAAASVLAEAFRVEGLWH